MDKDKNIVTKTIGCVKARGDKQEFIEGGTACELSHLGGPFTPLKFKVPNKLVKEFVR